MANMWLLKTEPNDYSFGDLVRDKTAVWDGVTSNWALQFLRQMKRKDRTFVYHTGKEKAVVGIAEVTAEAYPDPDRDDEKLVVVEIKPVRELPTPVSLRDIKQDALFEDFHLVTVSRLSVMPVKPTHWRRICRMGGL